MIIAEEFIDIGPRLIHVGQDQFFSGRHATSAAGTVERLSDMRTIFGSRNELDDFCRHDVINSDALTKKVTSGDVACTLVGPLPRHL
jgi:hypothetical protein